MQVFGPSTPVLGMRSAMDKSLLGPGWFQLLANLRCDDGLPEARNTDLSILAKPTWATAAAPLGCKSVSVNGAQYEVAVWSDGSKARVAVASSALGRWVEVTGTNQWSGPSGNNRLNSITAHCQLCVVRASAQMTVDYSTAPSLVSGARDMVVISNGEDHPRIWDPGSPHKTDYTVTAVANSGGLVQLTIGAHPFAAGDHVYVSGVGGTPSADGLWTVASVTGTQIRLEGSTFGTGHSNGTVTDRADLLVHKEVQDLDATAECYVTVGTNFPIAGGSSTTYAVAGVVNQARYQFTDSAGASAEPYTGTNSVIDWDITTAAVAADIAAVQFGTPITIGGQVIMLVEGESVLSALRQCKIELNRDSAVYASIALSWATLFDPTGTDATQKDFIVITENSAANRYWVIFDSRQVPTTGGGFYHHMRFTRQGAAPGANQQNYILFIGTTTSDIPASTLWGFHYEDTLNQVEQRFHVMRTMADNIGSLGGPMSVTTGASNVYTAAPTLPASSLFLCNWHYTVKQPTNGTPVTGGLDGIPESISLYAKLPGADTYYWIRTEPFYERGLNVTTRVWNGSGATAPILDINPYPEPNLQSDFNTARPAPSAYQQCMPKAAACEYVNQRLFVGAIKEESGDYSYSDYYYSWDRNPFRFQQVQEDEFRGGYGQAPGERVMAFRFSASSALGSGRVFMFSDQWVYSMGESGPFASAGLAASEIGRPVRIGPHGTLSSRSPAVCYNAMIWTDQDGQVMRLSNGGLENISRNQVDDRLKASVSTRKANITGAFWKDRYYLGYTPSGETTNEKVLVWNERMQAWESEDDDEGATNFELLHVWPTTPGVIYATRLFFYDTAGALFGYEEQTGSTVNVRWITGAYNFDKWTSWYINKAIMAATSQNAVGTLSRISSKWGASEPWSTTISMNESGATIATYLDSVAHTKTGTERTELDWEWYLDYTATVAPGTKIRRLEFEKTESNVTAGLGT